MYSNQSLVYLKILRQLEGFFFLALLNSAGHEKLLSLASQIECIMEVLFCFPGAFVFWEGLVVH